MAVRPGPAALVRQDKVIMRDRLSAVGIGCPVYRVVADAAALAAFEDEHGWPVIAKTSGAATTAGSMAAGLGR